VAVIINFGLLRRSLKNQSDPGGVMTQVNSADTLIGRRIRLRRIQLGIKTKPLATSVKITEARLQEFEAGRESIGVELLAEIAGALGVSSAYFFSAPRTRFAPRRSPELDVREGAR
jgi:transcriptional regulator with XRE-family HTH domain